MEDEQWPEQEEKGLRGRFFSGIKGGLAIFIAFPFLVILLPLWYLYRWGELSAGRPAPEPPWAVIFSRDRLNKDIITHTSNPYRKRRPYSEESMVHPGQQPRGDGQELDSLVVKPAAAGQVALVTGGGRRVGAAICRDLAAIGYGVAVAYHTSATEAEAVVNSIRAEGGRADFFALDLRNAAAVESIINEIVRKLGPVDLLINNASVFMPTPMQGTHWHVVESIIQTNLQGPLMLAMAAINSMDERGGQVINICDIWAEKPLRGHAAYSAAKAGLIAATQVLAREAAPTVRVNAIAPGAVLPPADATALAAFQKSLAMTPLASASGPDAILQAIRYLLTAHYVTGEVLHVDGGRRLV